MAVTLAATENALVIDYVYVAFCHIVTWMLPGTIFFSSGVFSYLLWLKILKEVIINHVASRLILKHA